MRESMILLKEYLNFRDYWIIAMFKHINLEIGNRYYEIDKETLLVLCEYLKNKDTHKLSQIWGKKSIQYDIFTFCEYLYEYFSRNPDSTKEEFQINLTEKLKRSLIKDLLLSFYDEIHYQYLAGKRENKNQNNYLYLDVDFDIHYLRDVNKIEIKEMYTNGDIFFYLVVDGLIKYDNKLLSAQDMAITTRKIKEVGLEPLASKSSIIIFVIKKQFLNKLNIDTSLKEEKLCKMCNMSLFNIILSRKEINDKNTLELFQLILYLLEKVNNGRNEILNLEWMEYKREIVEIVEKNYYLEEKEIGEKILEKLNMSLSKLYKVFKFMFNMTPGKYIEKIKVGKSYKLLVDSDKSVENIADELGYTFKTFSRKFEEITGYSPSKFRKMMRDS